MGLLEETPPKWDIPGVQPSLHCCHAPPAGCWLGTPGARGRGQPARLLPGRDALPLPTSLTRLRSTTTWHCACFRCTRYHALPTFLLRATCAHRATLLPACTRLCALHAFPSPLPSLPAPLGQTWAAGTALLPPAMPRNLMAVCTAWPRARAPLTLPTTCSIPTKQRRHQGNRPAGGTSARCD